MGFSLFSSIQNQNQNYNFNSNKFVKNILNGNVTKRLHSGKWFVHWIIYTYCANSTWTIWWLTMMCSSTTWLWLVTNKLLSCHSMKMHDMCNIHVREREIERERNTKYKRYQHSFLSHVLAILWLICTFSVNSNLKYSVVSSILAHAVAVSAGFLYFNVF